MTCEWSPQALETARRALQLAQADVGTCVGASAMSVSRWERGEATPDSFQRRLLGAVLTAGARPDAARTGAAMRAAPSPLHALHVLISAAVEAPC
jgi:transcriptional regulator with XRE-family HTH domain